METVWGSEEETDSESEEETDLDSEGQMDSKFDDEIYWANDSSTCWMEWTFDEMERGRDGEYILNFKNNGAVNRLKDVEEEVQSKWESERIYDMDVLFQDKNSPDETFLATFQCPYVNGRLRLSDTISLLKCDFNIRYNSLLGKKVSYKRKPFSFGFNLTDMSIKVCADRLKREMRIYDYPPKFPEEIKMVEEKENEVVPKDNNKEKENKATARVGSIKYQWQIMQTLKLQDEEIRKLANATYWFEHFPLLAVRDLKTINCYVFKSEDNSLTVANAVKKFSVDGTRLYLAYSDDSIKDDHLIECMAHTGIRILDDIARFIALRLHRFYITIKYKLDSGLCIRNRRHYFQDRVFQSKINLKIRETGENYSKMLYQEALRTGLYEFEAVIKKYVKIVNGALNYNLMYRYRKIQIILLSPICPHFCQYVWKNFFYRGTSILHASWPKVRKIHESLLWLSKQLHDTIRKLAILQENFMKSEEYKRMYNMYRNDSNREIHKIGIIWRAKTYSPWQSAVVTTMREIYFRYGNKLPDDKVLFTMLAGKDELRNNENRILPFVQFVKTKIKAVGIDALNLIPDVQVLEEAGKCNLNLREFDLFKDHETYICRKLNLDELVIKYTDEFVIRYNPDAQEDCYPDSPCVSLLFTLEIACVITISIINPQSCSNLFDLSMLMTTAKTASDIVSHIVEEYKHIKDPALIVLYRYDEPDLGPRTRPVAGNILKGKTEIPSESIFEVNRYQKGVEVKVANKVYPIGEYLIYIDKSLEK